MDNKTITISMDEYKELLIIKGKYEELKSQKLLQNYSNMPLVRTPLDLTKTEAIWTGENLEDYNLTVHNTPIKMKKGD